MLLSSANTLAMDYGDRTIVSKVAPDVAPGEYKAHETRVRVQQQ